MLEPYNIEDLIHETLLRKGLILPVTPEDVAIVETLIDEDSIILPESLRDPHTFAERRK